MPLELIVKIGLPPDPAGRAGSGHSLRQNALDPGFMTFQRVRCTRDGDADGADVA
jgi:hypothetical protein